MLERDESEKMEAPHPNLPTPPHSLLQTESDEMELGTSLDKEAGGILNTLKNYLIPHNAPVDSPSRRQTSLPVSSVSDDPVLATHFSNPSLPPASDAFLPTEAPLLDHERPRASISSENLSKLTGKAPDVVPLKNTPPLTPRAMSNEESAEKKSVTSVTSQPREPHVEAPQPTQDSMDSSADEITTKLDEAFPREISSSPQNGAPVGALKGKLFVKISEARGLRPSTDPYVVCVFEWNEYISKGAKDGEEEQKRRQMDAEAEAEAGRPMAIPMKSRQSSHNSALDGEHKGRMPVTDPHWDHEAVL
jgi:protein-serine/threonine kinase